MTAPLRLIFMGTPDFAVPALQALVAAGHQIVAVYTQPPRAAGRRGRKPVPGPVHSAALDMGLDVRHPVNFRDPADRATLDALQADAAIVAAYGLILPQAVLDMPRLGCFNIHASLLPRWRGAAPIHRALMAGDAQTGVTIMRMEAGLDTGPMIATAVTPIHGSDTVQTLHDRLAAMGADLMVQTLDEIAAGRAVETPQPDAGVTYADKIDKAEARIDWTRPAAEIERTIRALTPFPGAWFELTDDRTGQAERIKVHQAHCVERAGGADAAPGTALDDGLTVACGTGALALDSLQRAGKGRVDAPAFLNGRAVPAGTALG